MRNFKDKSYGRNGEVAEIYKLFKADRDIAMPGPRRLGKTFLLERLVDSGAAHGWHAVKVEIAGCADSRAVFRELCNKIGRHRSGGEKVAAWLLQRLGQAAAPKTESSGAWYQSFISLDHETYFERLVKALHEDESRRWALLIDELPIFLKALHDKGPAGIATARDFMNLLSRLRADYPRLRWLITGSIGIEPLAKEGQYMGVLAKFHNYELHPLTQQQAEDYVCDEARRGAFQNRQVITGAEAKALIDAAGWRAPFYIDALAQKLTGTPTEDSQAAAMLVENAVNRLLTPQESTTFSTWEEHLRKHYGDAERAVAFSALQALSAHPQGLSVDALLPGIGRPDLTRDSLRKTLARLDVEGFLSTSDWEADNPTAMFRNPLLRQWWQRFRPQANA